MNHCKKTHEIDHLIEILKKLHKKGQNLLLKTIRKHINIMAFVYQAKRNFNFSYNENLTLGPGSYLDETDQNSRKKNRIPFCTSSERNFSITKNQKEPGPGSYEPNLKTKMRIDHMGNLKKSSSFASNQMRFNCKDSEIPGPGKMLSSADNPTMFSLSMESPPTHKRPIVEAVPNSHPQFILPIVFPLYGHLIQIRS